MILMIIRFRLSATEEIRKFLISHKPVILPAEFEDQFIVITFDEDEKTFYMLHAAATEHGVAYLDLKIFKNIIYKKILDTVVGGLPHRKRINDYIEQFCANSEASDAETREILKSNYDEFIKFFTKDIKKIIIQQGGLSEP